MRSVKIFILIVVLCYSCNGIRAPQGAVPRRADLINDAFGGWIAVTRSTGGISQGELIAMTADSVFILDKSSFHAIPQEDITYARIIIFKTGEGGYAVWTFFGSLFTLTNGGFAAITFPATLITGIATTITEAQRVNYIDYPASPMGILNKYARFPQGLPAGLDPWSLKPRSKTDK